MSHDRRQLVPVLIPAALSGRDEDVWTKRHPVQDVQGRWHTHFYLREYVIEKRGVEWHAVALWLREEAEGMEPEGRQG